MGFAIPKIEYKNTSTIGSTTSGSGEVTNVGSVDNLEVGMFVKGSGIPAGATIGTIGVLGFTLANGALATATASDVALSFGLSIEFYYPPKEPNGGTLEPKKTVSEALSGVRQTSFSSLEETRALVFSFLPHALYLTFYEFLKTWGCKGKVFRYFEDKTLTTYTEYELDGSKITPKKIASKGVDVYVWEIPLAFRRVI
jgi:hypothetical protein